MTEIKRFECEDCGRTAETPGADDQVPECCGKPMAEAGPLPVCELSTTAEHARADDIGEPCDDGRAGSR